VLAAFASTGRAVGHRVHQRAAPHVRRDRARQRRVHRHGLEVRPLAVTGVKWSHTEIHPKPQLSACATRPGAPPTVVCCSGVCTPKPGTGCTASGICIQYATAAESRHRRGRTPAGEEAREPDAAPGRHDDRRTAGPRLRAGSGLGGLRRLGSRRGGHHPTGPGGRAARRDGVGDGGGGPAVQRRQGLRHQGRASPSSTCCSTSTARFLCTLDGDALTRFRTPAGCALAIRHLAVPEVRTAAALVGAGRQGWYHLEMLAHELPGLPTCASTTCARGRRRHRRARPGRRHPRRAAATPTSPSTVHR
jgi:hypothetical protein